MTTIHLKRDLDKAKFETEDPFTELNLNHVQTIGIDITSLTKASLENSGLENKDILRSKTCLLWV